MGLPRKESPRGSTRRRVAQWSALAMSVILPSVGCQVEYAGMTLPSGRYMHDDVQYFPSGPDFPWANTQAATQRARMRAMGIEPPPPPGTVPAAPGGPGPGMPPGGGSIPLPQGPGGVPAPPAPGGVPAPPPPGAGVPIPGPGGPMPAPAPGGVPAPAPGNVPAPAPGGAPVPGGP
jgi:hypothetical protein